MSFAITDIPNISYKKVAHGSLSGAYTIDVSAGFWHTLTVAGALSLSFTGFPSVGDDVIRLLLAVTNPGTDLTLAGATFHYLDSTAPVYTVSGVDIIGIYSVDGGSNLYVFPGLNVGTP